MVVTVVVLVDPLADFAAANTPHDMHTHTQTQMDIGMMITRTIKAMITPTIKPTRLTA